MINGDNFQFINKREGESEITFADITKINKTLGWKPLIKIEDFINKINL